MRLLCDARPAWHRMGNDLFVGDGISNTRVRVQQFTPEFNFMTRRGKGMLARWNVVCLVDPTVFETCGLYQSIIQMWSMFDKETE